MFIQSGVGIAAITSTTCKGHVKNDYILATRHHFSIVTHKAQEHGGISLCQGLNARSSFPEINNLQRQHRGFWITKVSV